MNTWERFRIKFAKILQASSHKEVRNVNCSTSVRSKLLQRWAEIGQDPGAPAAHWLDNGVPAGVLIMPDEMDAVFPKAQPKDKDYVPEPFEDEVGDPTPQFEADQLSIQELMDFTEKKYLQCFDSFAELCQTLGEPVVSKFHTIVKEKGGKVRRRTILDLKRSGMTRRTAKTHRVVLPRVSDLITDILKLLCDCPNGEGVEVFNLDFADAFWQIPLRPEERRFFVGRALGKFFAYLRATQ